MSLFLFEIRFTFPCRFHDFFLKKLSIKLKLICCLLSQAIAPSRIQKVGLRQRKSKCRDFLSRSHYGFLPLSQWLSLSSFNVCGSVLVSLGKCTLNAFCVWPGIKCKTLCKFQSVARLVIFWDHCSSQGQSRFNQMKVQEECHKDVYLSFNSNVHEMYDTTKSIPFDDFALNDISWFFVLIVLFIYLSSIMRKKLFWQSWLKT